MEDVIRDPCRYLGEPSGEQVRVRCLRFHGRTEKADVYACLHQDRRRRGKPGVCLPNWQGPWTLPEQQSEATLFALCNAGCQLRRDADNMNPP